MSSEIEISHSVLRWLLCSEEYLKNSCSLYFSNKNNGKSIVTRPTVLLFGYFFEDLLKSSILLIENQTGISKKLHLKKELFIKSGKTEFTNQEEDIIEFLNNVIVWGKYPEKEKGDMGNLIRTSALSISQNETTVFCNPSIFLDLVNFAIEELGRISQIFQNSPIFSIEFKYTLERIKVQLLKIQENLMNLNTVINHETT
ncbi:hypothetical protein [Leptospira levettii]|uniref:hypothetical protein n=1 Tax=Leptospira levettii TaxID=2023178 RepID=UPI003EB8FEF2